MSGSNDSALVFSFSFSFIFIFLVSHRIADDLFPKPREFYAVQVPVAEEDKTWLREELGKLDQFKGYHWLLAVEKTGKPHLPEMTIEDVTMTP